MKEQYTAPELNILLFAPNEKLASQIPDLDKMCEIPQFYSAGTGASWNEGDIFLPL